MATDKLARGGGYIALTTTPTAFDLSALIGFEITISCDSQDVYFCGAPDGSSTSLVTASGSAISSTALVADRVGAGLKAKRKVRRDQPFLVARTVSGSADARIKVVSDKDTNE